MTKATEYVKTNRGIRVRKACMSCKHKDCSIDTHVNKGTKYNDDERYCTKHALIINRNFVCNCYDLHGNYQLIGDPSRQGKLRIIDKSLDEADEMPRLKHRKEAPIGKTWSTVGKSLDAMQGFEVAGKQTSIKTPKKKKKHG